MSILWTSAEAAAATGGTNTGEWSASGVSIDTRSLRPGDLFVALKDVRDGHDFVAQALKAGAAAALVTYRPADVPADAPLLIVDDVLHALIALGGAGRARSKAKVAAITGSVGKTSTKEMLRAILAGQGQVHAAEASFNNHWGVPLTLARLPKDADFAIIEIGMSNPGEIGPLARMARPDVAMITTVAAAHLAAFPSVTDIAREKGAIFDGLTSGGVAVINGDLQDSLLLKQMAQDCGARIVTFGDGHKNAWDLTETRISDEITVARAIGQGQEFAFKVYSPGRHFVLNALGALAVAEALGADRAISAHDLGRWEPPAGRGKRERILLDPIDETFFDLIDDAFNANPASMAAALDVLIGAKPTDGIGRVGNGRRIAVLGDMLELGDNEERLHAAIADHPGLSRIALIHCVGPRMRALYEVLPRAQRGEWFETAPELAARARSLIDAGDILLVKGSKGIKVSLVVEALRNLGQAAAGTEGAE